MVQQQIFWLHVPMYNPQLVKILNSRNYLLIELAGFRFFKFLVFHYVVEQFSAWDILSN